MPAGSSDPATLARRVETRPQRWEYAVFHAPSGAPGSLNGQWVKDWEGKSYYDVVADLGEQGWEVVAARWRDADSLPEKLFLKRRKSA
jgi:hypothetical protein